MKRNNMNNKTRVLAKLKNQKQAYAVNLSTLQQQATNVASEINFLMDKINELEEKGEAAKLIKKITYSVVDENGSEQMLCGRVQSKDITFYRETQYTYQYCEDIYNDKVVSGESNQNKQNESLSDNCEVSLSRNMKLYKYQGYFIYSSYIAFIAYNNVRQELIVAFADKDGNVTGVYLYSQVTKNDYAEILSLFPIGGNINKYLKKYSYIKLDVDHINY